MYADFAYYSTEFYGDTIPQGKYPKYGTAASYFIDYITMGRAAKNAALPAVKMCCCALAEQYMTIDKLKIAAAATVTDNGIISSESVGSHSRSFKTGDEASQAVKTEQDKLSEIARRYLLPTGLLYRGGVSCVHTAHCNDL